MSLRTWIRCYKMILLQNGLIYIIGWISGMHYKLVLLQWSFTTGWHWENWKGKKIREKMMCEISDCKMVSYARLSLMRIKIGGRQFWAIANNKRCLLPIPPQLRQTSCVECGFFGCHLVHDFLERPIPTLALEVEKDLHSNISSILDRESNIIEATRPKMHPIQLCKGCLELEGKNNKKVPKKV